MIRKSSYIVTNYFITFLLLFCSGFAYYVNSPFDDIYILLCFFVTVIIGYRRKVKVNKSLIFLLLLIVLISFFQNFNFKSVDITPVIGIILKICIGYFSIKILGCNFINYFLSTMRFIALYSILLFVIFNIFPEVFDLVNDNVVPLLDSYDKQNEGNIFIYVLDPDFSIHRNSGPFWEPGAFQGYLNMALFFSISQLNKIKRKENLIFILAIITTLSTTGYIVLFTQIGLFSVYFGKRNIKYILSVPIIGLISFYSFVNIPFLNEKIMDQIESSDAKDSDTQRFNSFARDIYTISDNYLLGTGSSIINRYGIDEEEEVLYSTTGISNLLATYGIIFFIVFFRGLFIGINSILIYNKIMLPMPVFYLVIFILISISEPFPLLPFVLGVVTFGSIKKTTYYEDKIV